ncbi:MAG: hypothetical protein LBL83_08305 [Clostridiales bacterium]|jgi:hypothetical protein|nr:hypothetical protein [Clostridiales bacterium]
MDNSASEIPEQGESAARREYAFILAAKDRMEAEAYEEMFAKSGLAVFKEPCEPIGRLSPLLAADSAHSGFNLYVAQPELARARELLDRFENEPIEYVGPQRGYSQKSRANQLLFWFLVFIIFVLPIAIALVVIVINVARKFM